MAATDLHDIGFEAPGSRPGLIASVFATLAMHPSTPFADASCEAVLSQPRMPLHMRLSLAWWRAHRQAKQARRNVERLAETSPHLLFDVGLSEDVARPTVTETQPFGLRGELR